MSLPTKEQFEELKKKRKQDLEQKRTVERQVCGAQVPGGFCVPALIPYPLAAEASLPSYLTHWLLRLSLSSRLLLCPKKNS
jgi:hypothetical protein